MGVSGCGKSTVAGLLAARLGWDLVEGDDLHPAANVAKMRSGIALTDADRLPWLGRIAAWIAEHVESGRDGIVTCSALKRSYRDLLRGGNDGVVFVYLRGTKEVIAQRLAVRHGHYMPAALLDSQFADLEPPGADESAITVDIGPPALEILRRVLQVIGADDSSHETKPV
jgi:carbohydrate kinase (thermoresistant glucokinase family)